MSSIVIDSTLTCPVCGFAEQVAMPTEACQIRYQCVHCGETLRPWPGDCCIHCSYGSVPCPPIQRDQHHSSGCLESS